MKSRYFGSLCQTSVKIEEMCGDGRHHAVLILHDSNIYLPICFQDKDRPEYGIDLTVLL